MSPGAQVPGARPSPRRTGRGFEHVIAQETLRRVVSDDQGVPSFGTASDEPEDRRKDDHHYRRPHGVDRQVVRLPPLHVGERPSAPQKAEIEHRGPSQVDQEDDVLAQGSHPVRGDAELGDSGRRWPTGLPHRPGAH